MKKRIGIITHYYRNTNLGALLQSYALVSLLRAHGYDAQQICYDWYSYNKQVDSLKKALFPVEKKEKETLSFFKKILRKIRKKLEIITLKPKVKKQTEIARNFESSIPHSENVYSYDNASLLNKAYDIFITGSDQVFATYLLPEGAFYGEFASADKKVISYAASSNVKTFPPNAEKLFIKKLSSIHAISVREKTLEKYIEHITGRHAETVLDSTFLLDSNDWLKIANMSVIPHKPYIFCYFLGSKSVWQRQMARIYADRYGYELVHLPYIKKNIRKADYCLKGQKRFNVGPREFISLIKGAKCVFTDSFHGLAFSINLNKNFYVFDRDDKNDEQSMNARITDTLTMLGLESRHITKERNVLNNMDIDYSYANMILSQERERSIKWLKSALYSS